MNNCPKCGHELDWDGKYFCHQCQCHFTKVGLCPDCQSDMEKLAACGSVSYFCSQCNEPKSKSRVTFRYDPVNND